MGCWPSQAISMSCGSLSAWTPGAEPLELQHIIAFIFSLNRWLIRAYVNGLTAELNMTIVCAVGIAKGLSLYEPTSSKTWSIKSVPQQITKMAVIVTSINVTLFRTFNAPCVQSEVITKRYHIFEGGGRKNVIGTGRHCYWVTLARYCFLALNKN